MTNPVDKHIVSVVKEKRLYDPGADEVSPGNILATRSRYIADVRDLMHFPKIDTSDPVQVDKRVDEYLDFCMERDAMPTLSGAALAIGVTRETLWTWENGKYRTSGHSDAVKKVRIAIEDAMTRMLMEGKMNPAAGIFMLKNWYGYKDNVDINVTPNTTLADQLPPERIEAQLKDLPDD